MASIVSLFGFNALDLVCGPGCFTFGVDSLDGFGGLNLCVLCGSGSLKMILWFRLLLFGWYSLGGLDGLDRCFVSF